MLLLQKSPRAPASSLALALFTRSIPFGVKRISVHFICRSCLFHKLCGSKKGDTTFSILAVFLAPEEMPSAQWMEQLVQV